MIKKSNFIDVHVHLAALPDATNGCFMSPAYEKGMLVRLILWKFGLKGPKPEDINAAYVARIAADLAASEHVSQAVLLGLDGIYDDAGRLDRSRTHFLISNDYVHSIVAANSKQFFFGASVNPRRRDALDELERVASQGARLIKVLPPSQDFDPAEKKYAAFYRLMADKKIPLLCHIGYEFSVTAGNHGYGRPDRLELALDMGVPVIAAHASSSGVFRQRAFFEPFVAMAARYPNLYADLSAITLPNRAAILPWLKRHPELHARFLFGTDYPLSAYATPFLGRLNPRDQWRLWRTKNIFDKQAGLLKALGIDVDPALTRRLLKVEA